MTPYTNEYLRSLVRDDRVHRSIYTDPQIFELEMENLRLTRLVADLLLKNQRLRESN